MQLNLGSFRFALADGLQHHTSTFIGAPEAGPKPPLARGRAPQFRPNLVVSVAGRVPDDASLAEVVASQVGQLGVLPGFKDGGSEQVTTAGGLAAILQRHAFDNQDNLRVEQMQLYFIADGKLIVATASHMAGAPFIASEPEFRHMLLSVAPA